MIWLLYGFDWYRRRRGGKWWRFYGGNSAYGPYWLPCSGSKRVPDWGHSVTLIDYDTSAIVVDMRSRDRLRSRP